MVDESAVELAAEDVLERPTSEWWYKRAAVVYFFGAGKPPVAVKIGVTTFREKERDKLQLCDWRTCIQRRRIQIQSSNHEIIELLGFIRFFNTARPAYDAEQLERQLHKQFGALQLFKAHTVGAEWFKADPSLIDYIQHSAEIEKPDSLLDAP